MKLIDFFLDKAKLNYTLSFFLLLAGLYCISVIPRELFPPLDNDEIMISGAYAGASADNLDKIAVSALEDELRSIPQITKIESMIKAGAFIISATLKDGSDKNDVLSKIKDAISLSRTNLPSDMDEPIATIVERKIPLMQVAIASDSLGFDQLLSQAKEVKRILSSIPNLSITLYGESDKEIEVRLDSSRVRAYMLNPQEVANAISRLSYIFPLGKIESKDGHFYISTTHGKLDPVELGESMIRTSGKIVRLKEIATLHYGYGESSTLSSFNGTRALNLNISKDDKGNAIALAKQVKSEIKRLESRFKELEISSFLDTSNYIKNRLNTVTSNITLGFLLVSLCMYLLINARIAFVVALGIPFAFLLGSIFFYLSDNAINMISLLGALIAVGILVDDAIIVSENIQRHIEEGMPPKEAALNGAKEVIIPVLVAATTTIFAFLPMLLMSGEVGKFIKLIPIAITALLLASLVESFLFLPLHCAHMLSHKKSTRDWSKANELYRHTLEYFFTYKKTLLTIFLIAIPLMIAFGFIKSKYQLFSDFDGSEIYVSGRLSSDHTLEETQVVVKELERELLNQKSELFIHSTSAIAGHAIDTAGGGESAPNLFNIFIELEEAIEDNFIERYISPILAFDLDTKDKVRTKKSYEIEEILDERLLTFKESHNIQELNIASPGVGITKHDVEIHLISNDKNLKSKLDELIEKIAKIPGVRNSAHDIKGGINEIKLSLNPYGESLGLSEAQISALLSDYFLYSKKAKSLDDDGVVEIRLKDANRDELATLKNFTLWIGEKSVRLSDVVEFHTFVANEKIIKQDSQKQHTLYADVNNEQLTAFELLRFLEPELENLRNSGIEIRLGGEQEKNNQFIRDMIVASVIALFLIFMTLLLMFDSFLISFVILSVIPLSFLGVVAGHFILGLNLTMSSFVGILGLAGVVINDGIVMIDFIRKAKSKTEFFVLASKRLRPILLTSITTFIGLATLIFFPSGQAVTLQPLAVSLGFGLAWGTVLNLFYLPLFYALLHSFSRPKLRRIQQGVSSYFSLKYFSSKKAL